MNDLMSCRARGTAARRVDGGLLPSLLFLMVVSNPLTACDITYYQGRERDYFDPANAWAVEDDNRNHCDRNVRTLKGGAIHGTPSMLMPDIDFALRRFPNHPHCLLAVVKYQAKKGYPFFPGEAKFPTAECYVSNAQKRFPKNYFLWTLMGLHKYYNGQYEAAATNFEYVVQNEPNNMEAYYNLGLVRLAMKSYDESVVAAQKAYALGATLPGLRRKLQAAGAWPAAANP